VKISEQRAYVYVIAQALLWSFAPIIGILTIKVIPPILALSLMTGIALLFFTSIAWYRGTLAKIRLDQGFFEAVVAAVLLATTFSLIFLGLQYTTAGNAGIISRAEFFFSLIFFNLIRREPLTSRDLLGGFLMISGAAIVFLPDVLINASINKGDALILLANVVAPFINFFQRKARETTKSEIVLLVRTLVGFPVMLALAFYLGESTTAGAIFSVLPLLVFGGVLVFGFSKILWVEAIHRVSITKGNALASVAPVATLAFAYIILNEVPTMVQLLSLIPLFAGAYFLTSVRHKV
jgi:drug/metabolite transporter (DMT)-like permease